MYSTDIVPVLQVSEIMMWVCLQVHLLMSSSKVSTGITGITNLMFVELEY